jgi:hypothetical protein
MVIFRCQVRCHRAGKSRSMPGHGYCHPVVDSAFAPVETVEYFAEHSYKSWRPSFRNPHFTRFDVLPTEMFSSGGVRSGYVGIVSGAILLK